MRCKSEASFKAQLLRSSALLTSFVFRDDAHSELKSRGIDFGPFPDLDKAVQDDVQLLKGSKLVADSIAISGWVYEVETGRVRQVV